MKVGFSFVLAASALAALPVMGWADTYAGNGASGFGGPIGKGTLTITDDGAGNIHFSLAPFGSFSGNDLVLYLDTQPGGAANNALFTDNGDGGREAISGANNGNPSRALVNFAPGFLADKAISVEPGVFAGLFDLTNTSSFGFINGGNLAGSGSGPFTFSFSRKDLGLGPKQPFSFEGTLISTTAFRSNETIGNSISIPPGDPGFNGTLTFTAANNFAVPVPSSVLGGMVLLGGVGTFHLVRRRMTLKA